MSLPLRAIAVFDAVARCGSLSKAAAELYVTPVLWPDFTRRHLFEAILEFQRRDRRFGRVEAG